MASRYTVHICPHHLIHKQAGAVKRESDRGRELGDQEHEALLPTQPFPSRCTWMMWRSDSTSTSSPMTCDELDCAPSALRAFYIFYSKFYIFYNKEPAFIMYLHFLNIIPLQPKFSLLNRKRTWGFCVCLWSLEHSPVKGRRFTGCLNERLVDVQGWASSDHWLAGENATPGGLSEPKSFYSTRFRNEIISSSNSSWVPTLCQELQIKIL